jgi:hypothetical protein
VSQQLTNLGQWRTRPQQLHGCGVSQPVGVDPPKASAMSRRSDNRAHAEGGECAMRGLDSYEHRPVHRGHRPTTAQVPDHRGTDVPRERQLLDVMPFSADDHRARPPIDVVEPKRCDFTRAQAETNQHRQDSEIPPPRPAAAITGREERLNVSGCQTFRQSRQSPSCDRRHRSGQGLPDAAVHMQEPE